MANRFSPTVLLVKSGNEQRAVLENEKIERYIMKNVPGGHLLFVKDAETAKLIENLYSVRLLGKRVSLSFFLV